MALLPRRTAVIATFAAALLAGAIVPVGSAFGAGVPSPTPTGPASNTTVALKNVVLTWTPVAGASQYEVQVSPNNEWTNDTVTLPNSGKTVNALYEMPLSLPHDSYFWRVRAEVGHNWSPYSSTRQFLRQWQAPFKILQTPTAASPTIAWTPVQDASTYLVRFSTDPTFTDSTSTLSCTTHQTSFTPYSASTTETESNPCFSVDGLSDVPYYWMVVPFDDSSAPILKSDTSADPSSSCAQAQPECDADGLVSTTPFNFVAPALPSTSPTTAPTNLTTTWHSTSLPGATCDATVACPMTPTLSWSPVPNANSYRVVVYRDKDRTNTYRVYNTAWPELTPRDSYFDTQAGQGFFWVVQAGTCSSAPTVKCGGGATPSYHYTTISAEQTFAKRSGTVTLGSPAEHAVEHGRTVTFSWGDFLNNGGRGAIEARNYELQVSTTSGFTKPVIDVNDIDMTRFTNPTSVLSDGSYFWRVAPIDESGNVLSWSAVREVTVNAKQPAFSISTKDGVRLTGPLTIHVSEPIKGVSSSTVHVVPAGRTAADAVAGTLRLGASSTTYVFTPKSPLATGEVYDLAVSPSLIDANGNGAVVTGNGVRTTTIAKDTSKGWHFGSGWATTAASGARSGSFKSASAGHSATITVAGAEAVLYACKSPTMGDVTITVAGHSQQISEHQSFTRCGVEIWHRALPKGRQKLTVKVSNGRGNVDEVAVS